MSDTRTCQQCEYFDIGAMVPNGNSDCLNLLSPRFQTFNTSEACTKFYPDTTDSESELD